MNIFLDANALAKCYVNERGSNWVRALCDPASGNFLYIAQITRVEVVAVFYRKTKPGSATPLRIHRADALADLFNRQLKNKEYRQVRFTQTVIQRATAVARTHKLRAYDAVQLASALILYDVARATGINPPVFMTSDKELLIASKAAGFLTDDPENH